MKRHLSLLLILSALSCSDDAPTSTPDMSQPDMQQDTGEPDSAGDMADMGEPVDPFNPGLNFTPSQEGVSPDGIAPAGPLGQGEAGVGRLTSEPGFTGIWAHCRVGDFKLHNALIEVCIQSETTNRNEVFTGGLIVDAREVGSEADDIFDMLAPRIGFNVLYAEEVEVVRDGSDGGPAVLRVTGRDFPIAYLLGVLGGRFLDTLGLEVVTEYRLWPDRRDVEIVTWIQNPNPVLKNVAPGDWLAVGDRSSIFYSSTGSEFTGSRRFDWLATWGPGSSFGWTMGESTAILSLPVSDIPYTIFDPGQITLQSGEEHVLRRWFAVGDGSVESVRQTLLERLEVDAPTRTATILLEPPLAGKTVELWQDETPVTLGVTDETGAVVFELAPGTYSAKVQGSIGEGSVETDVDLTEDVTINLEPPRELTINVTDPAGPGIALVRIAGGPENQAHEAFTMPEGLNGVLRLEVVPGTYSVQVTRGMEYEIFQSSVEVSADTTVDVELVQSVPTPGWIASDFHQHMEPSTDSRIHVRDRILDNIAEGVEFAAATDHDVVTDLRPILNELGLEDYFSTVPGMEISPTISHVNVYPAIQDRSLRGNGTIELAYIENDEVQIRGIPEIFAAARAMPNDPVVQLNHPRGSSSLFETADYEPDQDPRTFTHEQWSTDFDTLEIVNRVGSTCALVADWSTFLNTGLKKTGLGNSDSHSLNGDPAGSPRNYLPIDVQMPGEIQVDDVTAALKAGRAIVASHAFMTLGDVLPGDTLTGGSHTFDVRVQTPSWSSATRLNVIVNGQVVQEFESDGSGQFDFDQAVDLELTQDSWVIFFAVGPRPQGTPYGNPTLAFSNPVYIDVDANGWTAPGETGTLPVVDVSAINNPAFCD
ncbi:hypothetical protein FRD01_09825 [Microvenator marinus]|uniref:Uncharacterized protein n=1 Tax=Microvenator marinus TaxID=2600177 RepID=A0A5B8XU00_9DELT|nr:CehA/McbA family metallohydrolase [Microvenator marinus]QED27533.1 hypothetical protein FRD01_09825 [Microvenator marinus]